MSDDDKPFPPRLEAIIMEARGDVEDHVPVAHVLVRYLVQAYNLGWTEAREADLDRTLKQSDR